MYIQVEDAINSEIESIDACFLEYFLSCYVNNNRIAIGMTTRLHPLTEFSVVQK